MFASVLLAEACSRDIEPVGNPDPGDSAIPEMTKRNVARILAELPIGSDQLQEVRRAVISSSGNGYDEEYTMESLFLSPGCGVGETATKAEPPGTPIRDLLEQYLSRRIGTKADGGEVQAFMDSLSKSGLQIYWPYSENWDGETFPLITFDPGFGAESNYAYKARHDADGIVLVDSVLVDERLAMQRPVWVINSNEDSGFAPEDFFRTDMPPTRSANRHLILKSIRMLRNYDSWFGGASEFVVSLGAVNGFSASTEAELKLYHPSVTTFTTVVKRSQKDQDVFLEALILSDFTDQMDKLAFMLTEDDGGTRTSWKCSAIVKVESKSYGFDLEIPYYDKDDRIWWGQLDASFFQREDQVTARFGDVILTFELL